MRFTAAQLSSVEALLAATARQEILPLFRNLGQDGVRTKTGPLDLVTAADEAAEVMITDGLHRLFPGCVVVGEEATSADPTRLQALAGAELAFVVDPIDGTANFAAGLTLFGVMAAAIIRGEVVASVIHDPMGNDSALALRGEGAWIETPDGRRTDLRVASPADVAAMTGKVGWRFLPEPQRSIVCGNLPRLAAPGTIGVRPTNTAWSLPGTATSCSSTGCIRGTMRRVGCCIARPAAIRPSWTAASTIRRASTGD